MNKQRYVVGLLFSDDRSEIVLIQKERPAWQRGMFNGPGGKVESGEDPEDAMFREFAEETGIEVTQWELVVTWVGDEFELLVFRTFAPSWVLHEAKSKTDEIVLVDKVRHFMGASLLPSLRWLIPLAQDPCIKLPLSVIDRPSVSGRTPVPEGARCQEDVAVGNLVSQCDAPATSVVFHRRDQRAYYMCDPCMSHNVSNRGGQLIEYRPPDDSAE